MAVPLFTSIITMHCTVSTEISYTTRTLLHVMTLVFVCKIFMFHNYYYTRFMFHNNIMQDHGQCNIQKYMDYPRLITLTIHNIIMKYISQSYLTMDQSSSTNSIMFVDMNHYIDFKLKYMSIKT